MEEKRPDKGQILCSGCLRVIPESFVHVIPHFNCDVGGYVTIFRCEQCWLSALEETRLRVMETDDEIEIASLGAWFEGYSVFLHEFRRGDPVNVVRVLFGRILESMQSGAIKLPIGPNATSEG
jgi:hypothetical protein